MNKIKRLGSIVLIVLVALVLLCSCGPKVKNGLVEENGYTYYYVNNEMQYGWQKIDGDYYYFGTGADVPEDQIGAMCKNYLIGEWDGPTYGLGKDGKMLKNQFATIDNRKLYFGADGAMITNTQKEINGKIYVFDEGGNSESLPDYQLVFNCTFPKTFRDGSFNNWVGDVIVESITYEYDSKYKEFKTYWTGTAGNSWNGPNHSTSRDVEYKLYDPEGYVISSSRFSTSVDLKMGEKFKDKETSIGNGKIVKKGIYKLELYDGYYK